MSTNVSNCVADAKSWYTSKTVIAGLVSIAAGAAGAFGFVVSEVDQKSIVDLTFVIGSVIGGIGAIYGRIKASKTLK